MRVSMRRCPLHVLVVTPAAAILLFGCRMQAMGTRSSRRAAASAIEAPTNPLAPMIRTFGVSRLRSPVTAFLVRVAESDSKSSPHHGPGE